VKYSLTKQRWSHKVIPDAESILRYTEEAITRLKFQHVSIAVFPQLILWNLWICYLKLIRGSRITGITNT
jgi:hypothetical protein